MKKILGKCLLALALLSTVSYSVDKQTEEKIGYINKFRSADIERLNGDIYDHTVPEKERKKSAEKLLKLKQYLDEVKPILPANKVRTLKTFGYLFKAYENINFNPILVEAKIKQLELAIQTPIVVPAPCAPIVVPAPVMAPLVPSLPSANIVKPNQQWNKLHAEYVSKFDQHHFQELIAIVKDKIFTPAETQEAARELYDLYQRAKYLTNNNTKGNTPLIRKAEKIISQVENLDVK